MLMLGAFVLCYPLTALGLRLAQAQPDPVRRGGGPTQRSPVRRRDPVVALIFLFVPLVVVVLFSFHKTGALSFPFQGFSLRWYRDVFSSMSSARR